MSQLRVQCEHNSGSSLVVTPPGTTEPKGRLHSGPGVEGIPLAFSKSAKQHECVPFQLMQTFLTS